MTTPPDARTERTAEVLARMMGYPIVGWPKEPAAERAAMVTRIELALAAAGYVLMPREERPAEGALLAEWLRWATGNDYDTPADDTVGFIPVPTRDAPIEKTRAALNAEAARYR